VDLCEDCAAFTTSWNTLINFLPRWRTTIKDAKNVRDNILNLLNRVAEFEAWTELIEVVCGLTKNDLPSQRIQEKLEFYGLWTKSDTPRTRSQEIDAITPQLLNQPHHCDLSVLEKGIRAAIRPPYRLIGIAIPVAEDDFLAALSSRIAECRMLPNLDTSHIFRLTAASSNLETKVPQIVSALSDTPRHVLVKVVPTGNPQDVWDMIKSQWSSQPTLNHYKVVLLAGEAVVGWAHPEIKTLESISIDQFDIQDWLRQATDYHSWGQEITKEQIVDIASFVILKSTSSNGTTIFIDSIYYYLRKLSIASSISKTNTDFFQYLKEHLSYAPQP
jgi:hypothetical protein